MEIETDNRHCGCINSKTCKPKPLYPQESAALYQAEYFLKRFPETGLQKPYKCPVGFGWHLTTNGDCVPQPEEEKPPVNPNPIVKSSVDDKASMGCGRYPQVMKDEARKMRAGGATYKEIAQKIGISQPTACQWCRNPIAKPFKQSVPAPITTESLDAEMEKLRQQLEAVEHKKRLLLDAKKVKATIRSESVLIERESNRFVLPLGQLDEMIELLMGLK